MLQLIELLAVISAAVYGVLLARRKEMDFVGVFSVALVTSFGGGTLRDVLLDRSPLFWIQHAHYPVLVFSLAVAATLARRWTTWQRWAERWLFLPDAFGLGLFSMVGASYALEANTSLFVASLFGVITGTFGGVIGDIVCNEVPSLFRPHTTLYATCSFAGCWVYLLLDQLQLPQSFTLWFGILTIVIIRLIAVRWDLRLPA
jgi:uncharacterized membrane protein YeiH